MVGHWLEATLTLLGVDLGRRWSLVLGRWWIGGWSLVVGGLVDGRWSFKPI
jgi:hypothetical protein